MDGLIHIYTGDGKGKTTASVGLMIRALGYNKKILFIQMQKALPSGEIKVLENNKDIDVMRVCSITKFVWKMNEKEKQEYKQQHEDGFDKAIGIINQSNYDLVVFDEILGAIYEKVIDEKKAIEFLKNKPTKLEIVLTGRNASEDIIKIGDYVSEIKCIKHPFEKGVPPRKGVEF